MDDIFCNNYLQKFLEGGFIFSFFIHLFIYFWLRWVFLAACGLSLVAASGSYSSITDLYFILSSNSFSYISQKERIIADFFFFFE